MEIGICFIGDSFVNGTGDPNYLSWAGRICQTAYNRGQDITYYNLGVRRETSTDIKNRWFREVSCRLPSEINGRLVFSFGANDICRSYILSRPCQRHRFRSRRRGHADHGARTRRHLVVRGVGDPVARSPVDPDRATRGAPLARARAAWR